MASQPKKPPLNEIDLACAATAPVGERERIIRAAIGGQGYPYYRAIRTVLPTALNVSTALLPAPISTKRQISAAIKGVCQDARGELTNNQNLGDGLYDYVVAHNVTGAELNIDSVFLGRAGRRYFWEPCILKIDGKKYIPFLDPRFSDTRLTPPARRFVFSIQHTHIRLANPTEWGDVGFVIFQFDDARRGPRKATAHFDDGVAFWDDKEIAKGLTTRTAYWTRFERQLSPRPKVGLSPVLISRRECPNSDSTEIYYPSLFGVRIASAFAAARYRRLV